ncbi:MAG: hypothetical protein WDK95_16740 [Syntrophorhabdaceae bacterium]|jgi:hypothetical protein
MALTFGGAAAALRKTSLNKFVALGEKATSDDFRLHIDAYPELEYLVQAAQMPALKREMVEIVGPNGVQVQQQGKLINAGELPITFIETIDGKLLAALRQWVTQKEYHTVTLALISEGENVSNENTTIVLEGCWLESEPIELSVDDNTALKPTGTLHYNWHSGYDEGQAGNLEWS